MKVQLFTLMTLWASFGSAEPVPNTLKIDCWDGTFFYNRINVDVDGEDLRMAASGTHLKYGIDDTKSTAEAMFALKKSTCTMISESPLHVACVGGNTELTVNLDVLIDGLWVSRNDHMYVSQPITELKEDPATNSYT